jgi:hypothetical protein
MYRIIYFFALPLLLGCRQTSSKIITGSYSGKIGNNIYKYSFNTNKTVIFDIIGDSEEVITNCRYEIKNDSIFINSLDKEKQDYIHFFTFTDTLFIKEDLCIKEISSGNIFCKQ